MESSTRANALKVTVAAVLAIAVNFSVAWGLAKIPTKGERYWAKQAVASQYASTTAHGGDSKTCAKV